MTRLLLGVFLALLAIEMVGLRIFREENLMSRFMPVTAEEFARLQSVQIPSREQDIAYYRHALPDSVEEVREILRWTMNEVSAAEPPTAAVSTARRAHDIAAAGGGLLCAQMSLIFERALAARGHTARRIQLIRSLFERSDTHVTVEVLQDGKWVIYDPTFHVSFRQDGELLGARDVRAALLDGTADRVEPVFHGEVDYPSRLGTYYLDWTTLFNNVLLRDPGTPRIWSQYPPLVYWQGGRWYYLEDDLNGPNWQVAAISRLYFVFIVALPVAILTVGLLLVLMVGYRRVLPRLRGTG